VLGRLYNGIAFRGYEQSTVEQLVEYAGVPVWNASTDRWHPTQSLADILTMTDHRSGPVDELAFCFTGDGRGNVARSLLVTGALLGMDVRIAAPPVLQPPPDVVAVARWAAESSGARILVTDDVFAAARDVDFVYTDVWGSMGEPRRPSAPALRHRLRGGHRGGLRVQALDRVRTGGEPHAHDQGAPRRGVGGLSGAYQPNGGRP
jgi:ornithine carbamoyltransferase